VSGPICTQCFAGKNGKVQTYTLRATALEMLRRKNASLSDAAEQACASVEEGEPCQLLLNSRR
jgi:anthranilate phosphoribosyltransferase